MTYMDHYRLTPAATFACMDEPTIHAHATHRDNLPYWNSMKLAAKRGLTFSEALSCIAVQDRVRDLRSRPRTRVLNCSEGRVNSSNLHPCL